MIKLHFDIISFYYKNGSYRNHKRYDVKKEYDETMTLNDVVLELYDEYKLENKHIENQLIPRMNELFWKKYFPAELCWKLDIDDKEYLNASIGDLEKQFSISKITIPLCLNLDGIGKSAGNTEGVKLYFHHNESDIHHKPHIHCWYSGDETRIEIETLKVLDKPFKKAKMDVAIDFIK